MKEKKVNNIRKSVVELYNKAYDVMRNEFTDNYKTTYYRGYIHAVVTFFA